MTRIPATQDPNNPPDPNPPLRNLAMLRTRLDSLHHFLSQSITTNTPLSHHHITTVSDQIATVIHNTIVNATALVSSSASANQNPTVDLSAADTKPEPPPEEDDAAGECGGDGEIVELDAVELLAEHIHFCEICGKGFRRDANLRMHMRAHGNQYKTPEFLSKPLPPPHAAARRFSCPFEGCNRNKLHVKFRALKSVACVRSHFKRSHCPKMYSCTRCHRKSFSVISDLRSHMKHCGEESKWRCTCGTTFSRKDKLFGHISLFEGHMPALAVEGEEKGKHLMEEECELGDSVLGNGLPDGFFEDLDDLNSFGGFPVI